MDRNKIVSILGLSFLIGTLVGCETQESLTRKRIKSVEKGLLRTVFLKGEKPERMNLGERMLFYKVPAVSMAIMDEYKLEWARAYGEKEAGTSLPVTENTLFQTGVLSQPLTAAAVLHFVDKGRLDLDERVNSRLRSWKVPENVLTASTEVTLRNLLTHTAGFPDWVFQGYSAQDPLPSLKQILEGKKPSNSPLVEVGFQPGSKIRESEPGYVVLQQLLEDIGKKPFSELMRELVINPFGMMSSSFEVPLPGGARQNAATGHLRDGRPVDGKWFNYPELAAKGLWSNPKEYSLFLMGIMDAAMGKSEKVISSAMARAMMAPQVEYMGLGFSVEGAGDEIGFGLKSGTRGFSSFVIVYPSKGQGAVIMTNSDNGKVLTEEIVRAISAAYGWTQFRPQEKPLYRLDPSLYQRYVGRYQVTPEYALDVGYEDYYLMIRPTGQAKTKFYVESETVFFSIDPLIRIQFTLDDRGKVVGLLLWQQDFRQEAKRTE